MQSLLKFITCGSVDDGKSTLIGHMLYDAKLLFADQKRALELDSRVGSTEGQIDYFVVVRRTNGRAGAGNYDRCGESLFHDKGTGFYRGGYTGT